MGIKAVLFDLDGTLLPMDQDIFIKAYFGGLAKKLAPHGYESSALIKAIWAGTAAMIKNNGDATNETVFWDTFAAIYGENARNDEPLFEEFYKTDFGKVQDVCSYTENAAEVIHCLGSAGVRTVLATNPIFPAIATESRIRWAGLQPDDFEFYTTYENINYCKPNINYYKEILNRLGLAPDECIMVGNDVGDDMVAEKMGMKVFLLTDNLINKQDEDISRYPNGGYDELQKFLREVISI